MYIIIYYIIFVFPLAHGVCRRGLLKFWLVLKYILIYISYNTILLSNLSRASHLV